MITIDNIHWYICWVQYLIWLVLSSYIFFIKNTYLYHISLGRKVVCFLWLRKSLALWSRQVSNCNPPALFSLLGSRMHAYMHHYPYIALSPLSSYVKWGDRVKTSSLTEPIKVLNDELWFDSWSNWRSGLSHPTLRVNTTMCRTTEIKCHRRGFLYIGNSSHWHVMEVWIN